MKLILLAATALIASPVIAQDTTTGTTAGTPTTQTTPPTTADPSMTTQTPATDPSMATTPTDPGAAAGTGDTMSDPSATQAQPSTNSPDGTAPMGSTTGDPVGGYQPSQPAVSGTATPGGPVTFQAAAPPSQAYPAPAPLASYPICKKGQYDKCRQRGGK